MTEIFKSSKIFWLLGLPSVLLLLGLTVVGSNLLIHPKSAHVTPEGHLLVYRDFPLRDLLGVNYPIVRSRITITPFGVNTNQGFVCGTNDNTGWRYGFGMERGFSKQRLDHFAKDCMLDPEGFKVSITYTALLFDILPLRPVTIETSALRRDGEWTCPNVIRGLRGERGPQGEKGDRGPPGETIILEKP